MLNDLCDRHDWDILAAKDNQEALELFQSRPFDLIWVSSTTTDSSSARLVRASKS
jgi:DNA-binding response OmpR family regulator